MHMECRKIAALHSHTGSHQVCLGHRWSFCASTQEIEKHLALALKHMLPFSAKLDEPRKTRTICAPANKCIRSSRLHATCGMSTRSHTGCWTCKRRRRRCDNGRPGCRNCRERGVDCEGYEVRLKWGAGIASRGRFTGADKPVEDSVPPRLRGRQRDLEKEMRKEKEGPAGINLDGPTADEKAIFDEFMNNGINTLHSTTARDSMLHPRLPQLCQDSPALFPICISFQLALTSTVIPLFCEYFDKALRTFRSELACSKTLSDATLTSGLLLCSIGLMHGLPWTMHLEGMHRILQRDGLGVNCPPTPAFFRIHLLEVMGVMDIPCFSIGRQSPQIGIWRRYCRPAAPRYGVEPVSGLPRTLLDIFAGIGAETTEQSFWDWSGEPGSFPQCYLWEAYRLAGILALRRGNDPVSSHGNITTWRQPAKCPANTTVLISRILASIDALRLASIERPLEDAFIVNAILFPVVTAGLEVDVLCQKPDWQQLIRNSLKDSNQCDILLSLLEELWQQADPGLNVHDLARQRGIEMGLL